MWKTDIGLLKQHEIVEQGSLLLIYFIPIFYVHSFPITWRRCDQLSVKELSHNSHVTMGFHSAKS